jgi:hypothetical protein
VHDVKPVLGPPEVMRREDNDRLRSMYGALSSRGLRQRNVGGTTSHIRAGLPIERGGSVINFLMLSAKSSLTNGVRYTLKYFICSLFEVLDSVTRQAFIFRIMEPKFLVKVVQQFNVPRGFFRQSKTRCFCLGQRLGEVVLEFIFQLHVAHAANGKKGNE